MGGVFVRGRKGIILLKLKHFFKNSSLFQLMVFFISFFKLSSVFKHFIQLCICIGGVITQTFAVIFLEFNNVFALIFCRFFEFFDKIYDCCFKFCVLGFIEVVLITEYIYRSDGFGRRHYVLTIHSHCFCLRKLTWACGFLSLAVYQM